MLRLTEPTACDIPSAPPHRYTCTLNNDLDHFENLISSPQIFFSAHHSHLHTYFSQFIILIFTHIFLS
ncbi:hypothetical protein RRG08_029685 [Elysia crispata]|uniref:Uncharacterized protein n=1 Tax=Elysia crispata TaxID=231223 RepID=A0AAE1BEN5_9GAST|nr:hypothetical protein RRG08_029685 [Elysia crispata]